MTPPLGRLLIALLGVLLPAVSHAQKKERDRVKREEILASGQQEQDLFLALRALRPRFLEPPPGVRTLGNSMQIPTAVVVDGKRMGGLETLHAIVASTVEEVRYLEPSRAGTEYGQMASGGAVVVKLLKGPVDSKSAAPKDSVPRPR
jgi:hypothetical protein